MNAAPKVRVRLEAEAKPKAPKARDRKAAKPGSAEIVVPAMPLTREDLAANGAFDLEPGSSKAKINRAFKLAERQWDAVNDPKEDITEVYRSGGPRGGKCPTNIAARRYVWRARWIPAECEGHAARKRVEYRGNAVRAIVEDLTPNQIRKLAKAAGFGDLVQGVKDKDLVGVLVADAIEGKRKFVTAAKLHDAQTDGEAVDLEASPERHRIEYSGSQREAGFRQMILDRDCHRCVLTSEDTPCVLEAAHLIPAKVGENDGPSNGVALRADLHRLFDAGAFTFDEDGAVRITDIDERPSDAYRALLRGKKLPRRTLDRVRKTLALPAFKERDLA